MIYNLVFVVFALFSQVSAVPENEIHKHLPSTWEEFTVHHRTMESLFGAFKKIFNKSYLTQEDERQHFNTFIERAKLIFDWNDPLNAGTKRTYLKGINRFSDLSALERSNFVMPETKVEAKRPPLSGVKAGSERKSNPVAKPLKGAGDSKVCDLRPFSTSVKDQGQCGSCWSFGTIAAAEASHFLWAMTDKDGNPPAATAEYDAWQLSEQVLMECCGERYSASGCGGGGVSGPLRCAVDMGVLMSTTTHPYKASTANSTCSYQSSQASAYVESWHEPCSNGDEACAKSYIGGDSCSSFYTTALKTSIEVIDSFYDYSSGVYSDPTCPNDIHNHAVAIVGWGTDDTNGKDYWIVRNSWGSDWGDGGYLKMERGTNMCCVGCENLFFQ